MKNTKRIFNFILIMLAILFVGGYKVKAVPDSITITPMYTTISLGNNGKVAEGAISSPSFPVKHRDISNEEGSKNDNVYCTSGLNHAAPSNTLTCNKTNWAPITYTDNGITESLSCGSTECGYGVAYIIYTVARDANGNELTGLLGSNQFATSENEFSVYDRYFWTEMLINSYLGTYTNTQFDNYEIMKTGLTYSKILENAKEYAATAKNPTLTISGDTNLTFTEGNDGYYYSNPLTITSDENIVLGNFDNKKFSFKKQSDGSYVVKISVDDVKPGTNEEFSVKISTSTINRFYSDRYKCGTSYQAVTINQMTNKTFSASKTIKGSIKGKNATKFSKISVVNQKELPGASLRILDENKETLIDPDGNAYEWVSTDEPHYVYGLPAGKYYLEEVLAPEGYVLSSELVEFEVKDDGSITEVIMENDLEVEVPDTLSSRSILLLVIGMFDIALGIGILLYVKKNKATE